VVTKVVFGQKSPAKVSMIYLGSFNVSASDFFKLFVVCWVPHFKKSHAVFIVWDKLHVEIKLNTLWEKGSETKGCHTSGNERF